MCGQEMMNAEGRNSCEITVGFKVVAWTESLIMAS